MFLAHRLSLGLVLLTLASCLVARSARGDGQELGYLETFALAADRQQALESLVPGSHDYYYYHVLHYQNTGQWDKVGPLLKMWEQRHRGDHRRSVLENRQILLSYDSDPEETLAQLRRRLNLSYRHMPERAGAPSTYPTVLDQDRITRERFMNLARTPRRENVERFERTAYDWLITLPLSNDERRDLLSRLDHPDYPGLVELIIADLDYERSRGFGHHPVHQQLTREQLGALRERRPHLMQDSTFIQTWLARLRPGPDVDVERDLEERRAYLERLEAFAADLAPAQNGVKLAIQYHRLALDRKLGVYDRERFDQYIRIPRHAPYVNEAWIEQQRQRHPEHRADPSADYREATLLPPVGDDQPLIREYLAHFFLDQDHREEFVDYLRQEYVNTVFAETRLMAGIGDPESLYSLLRSAQVQALRDRVDIDFAPTNPAIYQPGDAIRLAVDVKNVEQLLVRVYRIQERNYYQEEGQQVDTTITLDGLVPNYERTYRYDAPPIRRIRRTFELEEIEGPGVWVVEFIGGGRSSRAVVRKGQLRYTLQNGPAGHLFRVYDETNQPREQAQLLIDGHKYGPDSQGRIVVPYTTRPGRQQIILVDEDRATLDSFDHLEESYRLDVGFHLERESINDRQQAELILRPTLRLNGASQPLGLLENVQLTIAAEDLDGVSSSQTTVDFELAEDGETTHRFQVPPRVRRLGLRLEATVPSLSTGEDVSLSATETVEVNQLATTEKLAIPYLTRDGEAYVLEVRGRNGELRGGERVSLRFRHRDVKPQPTYSLQTDAQGRIQLGPLAEIASLNARMADGLERDWTLHEPAYSYLPSLTGVAGETLRVPWMSDLETPIREELGLLELRDGKPVADRFEDLQIHDGYLQIGPLEPGDYQLLLKRDDRRISLHLTDGPIRDGHVLGELRYLQRTDPRPMALLRPAVDDQQVKLQVRNAGPGTRVHVFASRYLDAFHAWQSLRIPARQAAWVTTLPAADSLYVAGRDIGDEYRYILDRRTARRYPGNLLARPGLLLNPWALRETETGELRAAAGEDYQRLARERERAAARRAEAEVRETQRTDPQDLNFLAQPARVWANLRPDEDGRIHIDREELGDRHLLWIVAADGLHTAWRTLALEAVEPVLRERRLVQALDPERHFVQRRNVDVLAPGQTLSFPDLTEARLEVYDSIAAVYRLFLTLNEENNGDDKLRQFAWLLEWPQLDDDQRREKYSQFACHELNFFLYHKDRPFFDRVVRPYLANKRDRTFMDDYLLGNDLDPYAERWAFSRLNMVERILLGRRLEQQEALARHVRDRFELLPPDIDRDNRLFELALQGSVLATEGVLRDFDEQVVSELRAQAQADRVSQMGRRAAAPEGGMMGGGMMGGMGGMAFGAADLAAPSAPSELREPRAELAEEDAAPAPAAAAAPPMDAMVEADLMARDMDDALGLEDARKMREEIRRFYRDVAPTTEWAENNYYHLRIEEQVAELIPVNAFWRDYARHDGQAPFLSTRLVEAHGNFAEMMLALAVLELPFEPGEHELAGFDPAAEVVEPVTLTAASPLIAFYRQVEPREPAAEDVPILVSQNFFQYGDRYRTVDNEQVDRFVTDEFLIQTVYGAQVVVTNPSSSRQRLDVLLQVPAGAVPVLGDRSLTSRHLGLEPFETRKLEYHFYFPDPGDYDHFPVHVARQEDLVAYADPIRFRVVREPSEIDRDNWDYLSQNGTSEQVVQFLEKHNVEALDLERIAWRMRDAEFFAAVIQLLEARFIYDDTLWSYSLMHNHVPAIEQYLRHQDAFVSQCGPYLESTLLRIDPVERHIWQVLEYDPLVNARAHQLGPRRKIVNQAVHTQYLMFLQILAHKGQFDANDCLAIAYYLLLQDRVEETLERFAEVDPEALDSQLQYAYFQAHLAFFTAELETAREIAQRHATHPVDRWRKRFENVLAQLDQIEGRGEGRLVDADDRDQQQQRLADTDPALEIHVEGDRIEIGYANLERVRIDYYLMDIELLFSNQPFVTQYGGQFALIRPNHTQSVELPGDQQQHTISLPDDLARQNVMIEVVGGPLKRAATYFSNSLDVRLMENYGQLSVRQRGAERGYGGVYVKVYARRMDGQVRFYKDGYTDLRGRFDYASVSGDQQAGVREFAILILSDEHGAVVREAPAPKR
ncbi:MAG: hypothetical protein EA424_04860 [Planctomycetaceae bacterium]|nr:MAG: hypothetical protein EA424_04860 [Planctomycetaceae bacterium]